jgi:hypothetical protein
MRAKKNHLAGPSVQESTSTAQMIEPKNPTQNQDADE